MIDLNNIQKPIQDDINSVNNWIENIYNEQFAKYFLNQRKLYVRLKSIIKPITDEELESILTSVPLELFSVSEKLSELKTTQEVIKMKNKQIESEVKESITEGSETKKKEAVDNAMLQNRLLVTAYSTLITRIENEMSFSRELVMSAKKIWDTRRATLTASPINPVDTTNNKTYINNNTTPNTDNLPAYKPVM